MQSHAGIDRKGVEPFAHQFGVELPTLSRGNSTLNTSTGRPEMSITTRDSVSSIGMWIAGIAGDAGHGAERLLHRLAERDADILGGVVVVDMEVADPPSP